MLRFKLSSELADGDYWTFVNTKAEVLGCVGMWFDEHKDEDGAVCELEVVEMPDRG